ncbi:hypothetical protein B0H19DRAFT_1277099 [Mycena capillaripes]|nr:hypothetical protein B0H19DRAFT_1277099 [Mycena capillaripes]
MYAPHATPHESSKSGAYTFLRARASSYVAQHYRSVSLGLPWLLPIACSPSPTAAGAAHFQIHVSPIQLNDTSVRGTRRRRYTAVALNADMGARRRSSACVDEKARAKTRRGSVYRRFAPATRRTAQGPPLCAQQAKSVGIRCGIRYRVARHYAGVGTGRAYELTSAERAGTSRETRKHAELGPSTEWSVSTSSSSVPGASAQGGGRRTRGGDVPIRAASGAIAGESW